MLDAHIIHSIRDADRQREERRSQVVIEIDPPDDNGPKGEDLEPEPDADRGPIVIPLREDVEEEEEDDAA